MVCFYCAKLHYRWIIEFAFKLLFVWSVLGPDSRFEPILWSKTSSSSSSISRTFLKRSPVRVSDCRTFELDYSNFTQGRHTAQCGVWIGSSSSLTKGNICQLSCTFTRGWKCLFLSLGHRLDLLPGFPFQTVHYPQTRTVPLASRLHFAGLLRGGGFFPKSGPLLWNNSPRLSQFADILITLHK